MYQFFRLSWWRSSRTTCTYTRLTKIQIDKNLPLLQRDSMIDSRFLIYYSSKKLHFVVFWMLLTPWCKYQSLRKFSKPLPSPIRYPLWLWLQGILKKEKDISFTGRERSDKRWCGAELGRETTHFCTLW